MKREKVLEKTKENLEQLTEEKLSEASDFIDFLLYRIEEQELNRAIEEYSSKSKTFDFLHSEEELYSDNDLKEHFN